MSEDSPEPPSERPPDSPRDRVVIRRSLCEESSAVFAHGDFRPMFEAYLDHVRRWDPDSDGLTQVMMRQALAGAALHLSCRPADEHVAWTLNIREPALNVFVTGDGHSGDVTGRVYTRGVETAEQSRLYVESFRTKGGQRFQSTIEVDGLDVLLIFEQYYTKSVQVDVRFFEITDEEFLMVLGLPMTDPAWIKGLSRESAEARLRSGLKELDQKHYRFACGCRPERIFDVVRRLYQKADDLFEGEDSVQVACPRCGREWVITREEFENPPSND